MPEDPLVSVVVTAYDVERYVGAAVRSALEQTFRRIEVIAVDDGSADRTPQILREINDPRLRVLRLPHGGSPAALNAGVAAAAGRYIAFLDGDDLWRPGKLDRHVSWLDQHPEVDMTFDWYLQIDEEGTKTGLGSRRWQGGISFSQLLVDNVIGCGSSAMIRREALSTASPFDLRYVACHDLDLYLRVALQRNNNICAIPASLTFYRRRAGQLSKRVEVMEADWKYLLAKMQQLAPEFVRQATEKAGANMSRYFAYVAYENGNYRQAAVYLGGGFARAPALFLSDARNWKLGAAITSASLLPASAHRALISTALSTQREPSGSGTGSE
jgi:glycosyltransferase involved in cell wall biosynthesis